jgi:hypothetical protein
MWLRCIATVPSTQRCMDEDRQMISKLPDEGIAHVSLPVPDWLTQSPYSCFQDPEADTEIAFFSLNTNLYSHQQDGPGHNDDKFMLHGCVHPYTLPWAVEDDEGTDDYLVPTYQVRNDGYRP